MIPFAANTAAETANAFDWAEQPLKIAHSSGDLHPSNTLFPGPTRVKSAPKRYLDRFSRFSRLHKRNQHTHTHRQTDQATRSVSNSLLSLAHCDAA